MRFPGILRFVQIVQQKIRRIRVYLRETKKKEKKRVTVIVGLFYSKSAD